MTSSVLARSVDAGASYPLRPGGAWPAGFVFGVGVIGVAGAGASLEGGDEAGDSFANPLDPADGRAGTCALAVARGTATRLVDCEVPA
jgi:hypothetical protein